MAEEQLRRYAAAPLETADTYRISDTWSGQIIAVVKGEEAMRRRLDQLNAEEALRRRPA
ncbi:hypothetical protein GCM10017083_41600 [Thalassobaculum fulvum]|uniref:Uncharacterized protein n=1 Tax=Thalassobaculum fulvum TaxID=1633335 RepID=A0A919CRM4_9PROT|nr:hypothetical protein [Thalassobaculum fulvum]GHD58519.1 hypothetical protein GCM10017083_41600 [Thalassobaculum fulvum]